MRIEFSDRAVKSYADAPRHVCAAFDKQLRFLLSDIRHPSLHAKKYDDSRDIWQARVTRNWRFYFIIEYDHYVIVDITQHPK